MTSEEFLERRIKPRRITEWLEENYTKESTRGIFQNSLKCWIKCFYGKDSVTNYISSNIHVDRETIKRNIEERINEIEEGIERYFNELDDRNFVNDIKAFINWARKEGYANLTIRKMSSNAKVFFAEQDPRCKINDKVWGKIKRTILPKSTRPATQDKILTKEQVKKVLHHLPIIAKALALFLLSTGARIGETIQLKMVDINLYSDPPEVNIREKYTKGEVGGRVMWFSYETRDAIIEWHKIRPFKKKCGGFGSFDETLVFNITKNAFWKMWNRALKRADGRRVPPVLAKRDPSTKTRIHIYHAHTLRKFFRTNMGLKGTYEGKSGVPDMVVHAWMGHKPYLSTYDKLGTEQMAEIYKNNMNVVTVYEVGVDEKARIKYKEMERKADELARENTEDKTFIDIIGGQLDVPGNLVLDEKKNMIIHKIAQIKVENLRAREKYASELEKALEQMKMIPV